MALPVTRQPGKWALTCYQGDTFEWSFDVSTSDPDGTNIVPVDLSNAEITMSVRKARGGTAPLVWTGNTTDGDIAVSGADNNTVTVEIANSVTEDFPAGSWVYDVQFAEGVDVFTYLSDVFVVTAEVTP